MTPFPILNFRLLNGTPSEQADFMAQLDEVCQSSGFFYLTNHGIPESQLEAVLTASNQFFDLSVAEKNALHIKKSNHFRGYSEMKNERDWREQIHYSLELPEPGTGLPEYAQLTGPNQWPASLGVEFRQTILDFMMAANAVGEKLLTAFSKILNLPAGHFMPKSGDLPYLLLKIICYYPQPVQQDDRPGVAPHCDWSWLTLLLQDEVGGLEIQAPDGTWHAAPSIKNTLSVNLGELLEIVSKGRFVATAHQVINPSEHKRRISVPVFINPPLNADVVPGQFATEVIKALPPSTVHVHRVVQQGEYPEAFCFGDSEWRRKGEGKWCHDDRCLGK